MSSQPITGIKSRYVSYQQLNRWLDNLAVQTALIAPRDVSGIVLYRHVTSADEIIFDYTKPVLSIKDAFFPPTESLFLIEQSPGDVKIKVPPKPVEQVVFGVRPCDASGLYVLDTLFITCEPTDTYYARRRENSTLIGIACREMESTCFCTMMGGSSDDARYLDLMLTEVDGGYHVEVITHKGKDLLNRIDLEEDTYSTKKRREEQYPVYKMSYPQVESWPDQFSDHFWEEMAERCLSCRACAYVCPTCRCFDVRDETIPTQEENMFERVRCWDSCTGEAYRRIAGGHNPRPVKGQRLRNRFYCKFYYLPLQYGPSACTGCGRCIDVCPVGVDIIEAIQHITGKAIQEHQNFSEIGVK